MADNTSGSSTRPSHPDKKSDGADRFSPSLRTFNVVPNLPERLEPLRYIAYNLWWTWDPGARELFIRLDRDKWEVCEQNPIRMLANVSQERLQELTTDDSYLAHLDRVSEKLSYYLNNTSWFASTHGQLENGPIAYFSMEFGLHNSLPIYSGGLGVLAGDHLKASSDLGVPLVAVGLFYRNGYFRQYLNSDGWQQEFYPEMTPEELPFSLARTPSGEPVRIEVNLPGRVVTCQVWKVDVGRVPLYLLDAHMPENTPEDRAITSTLYGGDLETRIQQEKILGVGGLRALRALGVSPAVCHMNEGHSAFLGIEWIRSLMEESGCTFDAARRAVTAGTIFTTHTPVPAGNDEFPQEMVKRYFNDYVGHIGVSMDEFLAMGRAPDAAADANFSMTILALRLSHARNGVSKLHGEVSRKMWQGVWPNTPLTEVPIGSITNAVHLRTWLSAEFQELFDRYLGPKWREESSDPSVWERVDKIPDPELWRAHERRRERLVSRARARLKRHLIRRGAPATAIEQAEEVLDPSALTIGFARRFATYKRATMLLSDPDRLARLVNDPDRPVQIIIAGKAHPRDDSGKTLIREIVHLARDERFRRHLVFLEDYEMNLARYLVEGSDVWLNTPRRPLEASGTSGMKAVANGVLHLSVLDGWWVEGYDSRWGWAIGSGEQYDDPDYQDQVESQALYDVLEQDVIPHFYYRSKDGLPRQWIAQMKRCLRELGPRFTMHRMVKEYTSDFYVEASHNFVRLTADNMSRASQVAEWLQRVRTEWDQVKVQETQVDVGEDFSVGDEVRVRAVVHLGQLTPADVRVQLYHGRIGPDGEVGDGDTDDMALAEPGTDGVYLFQGGIGCEVSGRHGFAVRILPNHPDLVGPRETGLVCWG